MLVCSLTANAQSNSIDSLIILMSQHGIQQRTLRAQNEAAVASNNSDLGLDDPSIGFNYLWGSPRDVGQRKDISITQSLDIATITGSKRREADARNMLANATYERGIASLEQEAILLLVEIAAANETSTLYTQHIAAQERLIEMCRKRIDAGDIGKLDLTRATLALATLCADAAESETQRCQLLNSPLVTMNLAEVQRQQLPLLTLEAVGQAILRRSPAARLTEAEASELQNQVSVAKAELTNIRRQNLPSLTAGFMAELTREEKFKGITLGLNIPVWNNARRVKSAKAQLMAAETENQQKQAEIAARTEQRKQLCASTGRQRDDIKRSLDVLSSQTVLLQKAFSAGEISMTEYLIEQDGYYDLRLRYIQASSRHLTALCISDF